MSSKLRLSGLQSVAIMAYIVVKEALRTPPAIRSMTTENLGRWEHATEYGELIDRKEASVTITEIGGSGSICMHMVGYDHADRRYNSPGLWRRTTVLVYGEDGLRRILQFRPIYGDDPYVSGYPHKGDLWDLAEGKWVFDTGRTVPQSA